LRSCFVEVDPSLCKGCFICVEMCPMKALEPSDKLSELGYRMPRQVGRCVGCRRCENMCPDFAISVVKCVEEQES